MTGIICSLLTDGLWQARKSLAWDTYQPYNNTSNNTDIFKNWCNPSPLLKKIIFQYLLRFCPQGLKGDPGPAGPLGPVGPKGNKVSESALPFSRANRHAKRFHFSSFGFKRILRGIRLILACCNPSHNKRSAHLSEVLLWLLLQTWLMKECCYCFHNLARSLVVI